MNKAGKIILGIVLAIMIIAIGIGIIFAYNDMKPKVKAETVDYEALLEDDPNFEPASFYYRDLGSTNELFIFNTSTKTYVHTLGENSMEEGAYTNDRNALTLSAQVFGQDYESIMIVDGDYCFPISHIYDSELPLAPTFDAIATLVYIGEDHTGYSYFYTFREDGTYNVKYYKDNRTLESDREGKYSVDPSTGVITHTLEDQYMPMMYIYKGHLVNEVYKHLSEEEYMNLLMSGEEETAEE